MGKLEKRVYGLYVRVSTKEQAKSKEGSLRSQEQRLRDFLRGKDKNGVFKVYIEEGKSAKDMNRPEFQRLSRDIVMGKIHAVVCTEISRISRNVIDFHQFSEFCNQHSVDIISLKENFDTSTAAGKLLLTMSSALSQFEREQISERISASFKARAKRGLYNGGRVYGYRSDVNRRGYLVVDEYEAKVVNLIFDKYLELGSYCKAANWINKEGYRTREYTSKNSKYHAPRKWGKSVIWQILQNPVYIAKKWVDEKLIDAVWEPIIEEKKWHRAQTLLKRNSQICGNTKTENKQHTYLLRSIVHCGECGSVLRCTGGTSRNAGKVYHYYAHSKVNIECNLRNSFWAEELENLVIDNVLGLVGNDKIFDSLEKEINKNFHSKYQAVKDEIYLVEKNLAGLEDQADGILGKLYMFDEDKVKEFVQPKLDEISERKKNLSSRKLELSVELERLEQQKILKQDIVFSISSLADVFDDLNARQKQSLLELFIEKVEIFRGEIRVFLKVYQKPPEPCVIGFSEPLDWWTVLDLNQ